MAANDQPLKDFAQVKTCPLFFLKGSVPTVQEISSKSAKEAREMLYGPGGVFGPKGPFSTPAVRYPGGLEVPPPPPPQPAPPPTGVGLNLVPFFVGTFPFWLKIW